MFIHDFYKIFFTAHQKGSNIFRLRIRFCLFQLSNFDHFSRKFDRLTEKILSEILNSRNLGIQRELR
jgi:hypothetical protein